MEINIIKDKATLVADETQNSGAINEYTIIPTFSSDWDNLTKVAIFLDGDNVAIPVTLQDGIYTVPKLAYGKYFIGFVGYSVVDGIKTKQISTNLIPKLYLKGAGDDSITLEKQEVPTATIWEQYVSTMNFILTQTQSARDITVQAKTDVQGLKSEVKQDIATGISTIEGMLEDYNNNASAKTTEFDNNASTKKAEVEAIKDIAVSAKDTAVVNANQTSIDKDTTNTNVATTEVNKQATETAKQEALNTLANSNNLLQQTQALVTQMPTTYYKTSIEEMNAITNPKQGDKCYIIDFTTGQSKIYIYDIYDIDADEVTPEWVFLGNLEFVNMDRTTLLNILQLPNVATSGSYNDLVDKPNRYESFETVTDGVWDYSTTDKIILTADLVSISNMYNGAVGMIVSELDITLPANSKKAVDYDYMSINEGQKYIYTFYYDGTNFNWSRTVIA